MATARTPAALPRTVKSGSPLATRSVSRLRCSTGVAPTKATIGTDIALDYVGPTSEFHSVVQLCPSSNGSHIQTPKKGKKPNVAAESESKMSVPTSPILFDPALLHNVLRHTPSDSPRMMINDMNCFFEAGETLTAVALCAGKHE